ncbi:hypothetical protein E2C01_096211 [Portunus trituberculatus]|uniref:Uncharacterized protein n=1 Tax=Portunus trituberculatus TaxID=210409 RepID=A0A5B7K5Z6_PORTR|nr:hypothetical protein [Portunus trituberculatus]
MQIRPRLRHSAQQKRSPRDAPPGCALQRTPYCTLLLCLHADYYSIITIPFMKTQAVWRWAKTQYSGHVLLALFCSRLAQYDQVLR